MSCGLRRKPCRQPGIDRIEERGAGALVAQRLAEPVQRARIEVGEAIEQLEQALAQRERGTIEQRQRPRDTAFRRCRGGLKRGIAGVAPGGRGGGARHLVLRQAA